MRDRKRKTAFFDQKNIYSFSYDKIVFFLIEKSRSKNTVFRFRSAFSISHKIEPIYFFQIEKRRFSFSICLFDLA